MAVSGLGIHLEEINKIGLLNQEEEQELAQRIESGDLAARDLLIKANLRLVVAYAKEFQGQGLSIEDLIAEGNLILIHYVERILNHHKSAFDWRLGYKLSTHFHLFFMSRIRRAIRAKRRLIYLPDGIQSGKGNESNLAEARRGIIFESDEVGPLDIVSDYRESLFDDLERQITINEISVALESSQLDDRQKKIVKMRFGLGEPRGRRYTFAEIGDHLGVCKERIRQLEKGALDVLRRLIK